MASTAVSLARLLEEAVTEPGIISTAYRTFHTCSFGNQLLALSQCFARGIQPGPIATFQRWKELGRHVRLGEKAITLCRPVTVKRTTNGDNGTDETHAATWFVYAALVRPGRRRIRASVNQTLLVFPILPMTFPDSSTDLEVLPLASSAKKPA